MFIRLKPGQALCNIEEKVGSGCGSVGTAVTSGARGPRFESSHWQTFISDIYLLTVNSIEKTKIKKKRPRMAHLKIIGGKVVGANRDWGIFSSVASFVL